MTSGPEDARIADGIEAEEPRDRLEVVAHRRIAPVQGLADRATQVRADESVEIGPLDRGPGRLVIDLAVDFLGHIPVRPDRDLGHLGGASRGGPSDDRDRLDRPVRERPGPLEDRVRDDLDPIPGPKERTDGPRLVAEDSPVEAEIADQ